MNRRIFAIVILTDVSLDSFSAQET